MKGDDEPNHYLGIRMFLIHLHHLVVCETNCVGEEIVPGLNYHHFHLNILFVSEKGFNRNSDSIFLPLRNNCSLSTRLNLEVAAPTAMSQYN